eukprot:3993784-Prymnesium_polylepis.1
MEEAAPPSVADAEEPVEPGVRDDKTWSSRRYVQICTFVAKPYRPKSVGAAAVGRAVRPDRAS